MNDNESVPNPELREFVTSHNFVLTLQKTHIAMLIAVAHDQRPILRNVIAAASGLKTRGLLLHATDVYGRPGPGEHYKYFSKRGEDEINSCYRLTKAGWAVFDLLVQAGLATAIDNRSRKVA